MSPVAARYFDGRTSVHQPVTILFARGSMKVIGQAVDLDFDARLVRRSLRVADTPRWLYLPGGGACVTDDNDAVDRITRPQRYERTLYRWESRPAYAAFAVALVAATAWALLEFVLPVAVRHAAQAIPVESETALGRQTLAALDAQLMQSSDLPSDRRRAIELEFARLVRAAGATTPYQLEFRSSRRIGPNAFALPSGIIVVTDDLVRLAREDDELLGVLAHELGHVHHRHTMRRLLEGSATALVIAGMTGDVSSAAALATAAPTLLLQTKYSRANEREADVYAIELMQKSRRDPRHLAAILVRLGDASPGAGGTPGFLSSHPPTRERQALATAGAPPAAEKPGK